MLENYERNITKSDDPDNKNEDIQNSWAQEPSGSEEQSTLTVMSSIPSWDVIINEKGQLNMTL